METREQIEYKIDNVQDIIILSITKNRKIPMSILNDLIYHQEEYKKLASEHGRNQPF
jgi:hypothetical protein